MPRPRTFNLADIFATVAQVLPHRTAFVCGQQQFTFQELDERSSRLAASMRTLGIQRGDNVGIELYNSAEYLESFFACCKIGAVPANINYRYVSDELQQLFTSLDLKALVFGAEFRQEVAKVTPQVPTLRVLIEVGHADTPPLPQTHRYDALLSAGDPAFDDADRSENDLTLLCTGGTTGLPKGVMWPHKSLFMGALGGGGMYFRQGPVASLEELAALVRNAPEARYFALAPMMHGAAMWASLISLFAGQTVVVNDQAHFDPVHVWDVTEKQKVTLMSGVGDAMALPLVQALEAHPQRWNLQHVMLYGNGGAPLSAHVVDRLKAQLPHLMINNGLGTSEGGFIGGGSKPASGDGLLVLPARPDLAVVTEDMRLASQPGSVGILARTGYTPIGYYGDPKKTAETFVTLEGRLWVITGDQARIDENGDIVLLGRGSQCINTGGEKVFPEEVEEAVRRYAAVQDVLVVGVPDERWGQRVAAVVELAPEAEFSAQTLEKICREHLAGYKVPRSIYVAERVVRSPAGKADYRWAKAYAAEHPSVI